MKREIDRLNHAVVRLVQTTGEACAAEAYGLRGTLALKRKADRAADSYVKALAKLREAASGKP